jgi:ribosomal protein L13E
MVRKKYDQNNQCNKQQENGFAKAAEMYNMPQSVLKHCHGKNKLARNTTKN